MMRNMVIIAALTVGMSALGVQAQNPGAPRRDQNPRGPQDGGPGHDGQRPQPVMQQRMHSSTMSPERLKKLGATDAQIEALEKIHFDAQDQEIDLRAKNEKAQLALDRQLQSDTPDEKATMKAVDALNEARSEMFKHQVAMKFKIQQTLGAELSQKLRDRPHPPMPNQPPHEPEQK